GDLYILVVAPVEGVDLLRVNRLPGGQFSGVVERLDVVFGDGDAQLRVRPAGLTLGEDVVAVRVVQLLTGAELVESDGSGVIELLLGVKSVGLVDLLTEPLSENLLDGVVGLHLTGRGEEVDLLVGRDDNGHLASGLRTNESGTL